MFAFLAWSQFVYTTHLIPLFSPFPPAPSSLAIREMRNETLRLHKEWPSARHQIITNFGDAEEIGEGTLPYYWWEHKLGQQYGSQYGDSSKY